MDAIIGLGGNLGSREAFVRAAVSLLGLDVVALSPPYLTEPIGPPQPHYVNAAVRVRTALRPRELFARMMQVERALGRVREERWAARTIDLDLLWTSDGAVHEADLEVPHPRMRERAFALAPLLDVAPELGPELGPDVFRLGRPASRAWSQAEKGDDRLEVRALDDADALALALSALRGPTKHNDIQELCCDTAALLEAVGSELRARLVVIESLAEGSAHARIVLDPAPDLGAIRLELRHLGGGRCVLATHRAPKLL